jgi:hypothetical protein
MVAGTGTGRGGHSDLQNGRMPLSSHTPAGAGQLGTLLMSQPQRGRQEDCGPVPTGALDAIGLQTRRRLAPIQQVRGVCPPEVRLPVAGSSLSAATKGHP